MKRIDFLGAPGVGKSTIVNLILKRKSYFVEERVAIVKSLKEYNRLNTSNFFVLNILLSIKHISSFVTVFLLKFFFTKNINTIFLYLNDFLIKSSVFYTKSEAEFNGRRILGYSSFLEKCSNVFLISNFYKENDYVLYDESLAQRIFSIYGIRYFDINDKYFINEYFSTLPLPDFLIYVYDDPNVIVQNILKRDNLNNYRIPGHVNLNENDLLLLTESAIEIAEIGKKILKQRGCIVYEIQSSCFNKEEFLNFIDVL